MKNQKIIKNGKKNRKMQNPISLNNIIKRLSTLHQFPFFFNYFFRERRLDTRYSMLDMSFYSSFFLLPSRKSESPFCSNKRVRFTPAHHREKERARGTRKVPPRGANTTTSWNLQIQVGILSLVPARTTIWKESQKERNSE